MLNCFIKLWPIFQRLLAYSKQYKKSLYVAFSLLIAASIAEVSSPILIRYFIQHIIEKKEGNFHLITLIILCFFILQIIASTLTYIEAILFNKISVKIVYSIRSEVMRAALVQPVYVFDSQPIGQLVSKVTNDTEVIRELYDTVISTTLRGTAFISTMLISMFFLEWHMAILAITMIPIVLVIMLIHQRFSTPLLREVRFYIANINNKFNEIINGMNVVKQFNQEDRFGKYLKETSYAHYLARIKVLKLDGFLLRPLLSFISSIILCSLMILVNYFSNKLFEVGVLYAFINYLGRLNEPLIAIITQQTILQQAIVAGERIFELIDSPKQNYGESKNTISTGKITINNLNFSYSKNSALSLNNINLKIPNKKFIAFVGNTGSGKSTLVNLIMGFYPIKKKCIFIDNKDINSLSYFSLRTGIAIVQQDPIILADTILNNIDLGRKISIERILKTLKLVKLYSFIKSMPNGIHTMLGEQGNNLSVGQKQLLAIARVLVIKPKILILDEATANIDSETERKIQETLTAIRKNTTLVIIAHRLSTIIDADNIIVLKNGKIIEKGTHKELINKRKLYSKMYKGQTYNK